MHYVCRNVTELPEYMSVKIYVPANTEISAGEVLSANNIDTTINGNLDVYQAQAFANVKDIPVIILNNSFESMADGRRVDGNPDYTTYVSKAGDVITGIRLLDNIKFELGIENLNNVDDLEAAIENGDPIAGTYLYPVVNSTSLTWTNDFDDVNTKVYLYIESLKSMRIGGQFGAEFIQTLVVRVKSGGHSISSINLELEEGLQVGNENVDAGATIGTFDVSGEVGEVTIEFEENETLGADNDSFVIDDMNLKVGEEALGEAKTYQVYVKAEDELGNTYNEGFDIEVAPEE